MCAEGGEPPIEQEKVCNNFHSRRIAQRSLDAARLQSALIFSEFGACMGTEACSQEIRLVTDNLDDHLVGWAYWQFKNYADLTTSAGTGSEGFYNEDGTFQAIKAKALARTYLMNTQGVLTKNKFDAKTA